MPDLTLSTLEKIVIKVRRLTRSLSENNLSDADIKDYINNFVLYDIPEHLRLFNLRTTFTFYTQPNVDVYETNTTVGTPLYNFKNQYITVHPPVYIAGYQSMYSQSRDQFFGIYPFVNSIQQTGLVGDGVETNFSGFVTPAPILRGNVLFTYIDDDGNGIPIADLPVDGSQQGGLVLTVPNFSTVGIIDYVTGEFSFIIPPAVNPPGASQPIISQTVPYVAAIPQALLFYDGKFTVRPVPDQSYAIQMEVYRRPTELLENDQMPELSEWWEWIAYGASRKVYQDRMDNESLAQLEPEYKQRETLALRRTIVQQTNQRTSTIYTEQTAGASGLGGFYGGGQY